MNETEEPVEEPEEEIQPRDIPARKLPTIPLLERLPSKTCRKLLAEIRRREKSHDQLFRLVKDHAGRGKLQPGEMRCLTAEINMLYAPNRRGDKPAAKPKDDASKGIRDAPEFKEGFFRKPPSWGQKKAFGPRESGIERNARERIQSVEARPGQMLAAKPGRR